MLAKIDRDFTRILVLAVLALAALGSLGTFVMSESRSNLYEEKKQDIKHVVESAGAIVAGYDRRAKAGQMTREQAQAEAMKTLDAIRYGNNDYVTVLDNTGTILTHPIKPELVGKNRLNDADPKGTYYIRE